MSKSGSLKLTAADGHQFEAYRSQPAGAPKGGVVVLQEIFGLNAHIKSVADQFAAAGYLAVAPAMFDRIQPGLIYGYDQIQEGRDAVAKLKQPETILDLNAAAEAAAEGGPVAHVGYCWGGAIAYLAACKAEIVSAAVDYYGTRTIQLCEEMKPAVPVMYHFGALDKTIPPEAIEKIKAAHPAGIFHVYENADHGFHCDQRPQFNAAVSKLAMSRTLEFLGKMNGG